MKISLKPLVISALFTLLPISAWAQDSTHITNQKIVLGEQFSAPVSTIGSQPITDHNKLPDIERSPIIPNIETSEEAPIANKKLGKSPWSASAFYLYNDATKKTLLVPSPGYEMGGFKVNAQSASFTSKKFYEFEAKASTNWSIGEDQNNESKLLFMANTSIKRRLVVAVPFIEISRGLSFKNDYSQINMGLSSFIPTPWFFILPKYTATYSNANMNQFAYGVKENGWSAGWSATLLKPINENWTFLAIYSAKKLEESLRINSAMHQSHQSLMMILSYQFNKKSTLY